MTRKKHWLKDLLERVPVLGPIVARNRAQRRKSSFPGSQAYWETRYAKQKNSGPGSYGEFAAFKADIMNAFVRDHAVQSVVEFGCGDGNQLTLISYPAYLGLDVSATVIAACQNRFSGDATKRFAVYAADRFVTQDAANRAELALSLDVLFHLVEEEVFDRYMQHLFDVADRYVVIYSTDTNDNAPDQARHVRHRKFTAWVEKNRPAWRLIERVPNRIPPDPADPGSLRPDFYFYAKA